MRAQPAQGLDLLAELLALVRIEHSLFALPFVYAGTLLAHWWLVRGGAPAATGAALLPPLPTLLWVLVAAVGARTAAMGLNRLIDRSIDSANPRTAGRGLVVGRVTATQTVGLVAAATAALVVAAWQLNPLCLLLCPVPLVLFVLYPYAKRVSAASHLLLGAALAMAPLGGWLAISGSLEGLGPAVLLAAAMGAWVAGFDVVYSLQDLEVDRRQGLHSLPARLGVLRALRLVAVLHGLALAGLVGLWLWLPLSDWGLPPIAGIGLVLGWELAHADDPQRAFFWANVVSSALLLLAVVAGIAL